MAEFVNLDARWLIELTNRIVESEPSGEGFQAWNYEDIARLHRIAEHLQSMDEKLQNLSGEFARGVAVERERIFGRTNLPLQSVEVSPELRAAVLSKQVAVKKIARGVSGLDEPKKAPKMVKKVSSPALQSILSSLKIDISKIGVK